MVIYSESPAVLESIEVLGILEVENNPDKSFTIQAKYIYVSGRFLAGSEEEPFEGELSIMLDGDMTTPEYEIVDTEVGKTGVEMGAKAIGMKVDHELINIL